VGSPLHVLLSPRRDHRHHRQLLARRSLRSRPTSARSLPGCSRTSRRSRWRCSRPACPGRGRRSPKYMRAIGQRLGVNVGTLVGHSAVRLYAMGDACSDRTATAAELATMQRVVKEALDAGALGLSITRNMNHFDIAGTRIPAACAPESELFALADVLREAGNGRDPMRGRHQPGARGIGCSAACPWRAPGRSCTTRSSSRRVSRGAGKKHLAHVEETARQGIRAIPLCNPGSVVNRFTMRNCQVFRSMPTWLPILQGPDDDKLRAYRDPSVRVSLRAEVEGAAHSRFDVLQALGPHDRRGAEASEEPRAARTGHRGDRQGAGQGTARHVPRFSRGGRSRHRLQPRRDQHGHRGPWRRSSAAPTPSSASPTAGAHVQFHSNVSNPTRLLGYWVREKRSCRSSWRSGG